jgi:mitochondrial fission protein ELM1
MKAKVQQRCLDKKSTLVDNERRFKRACEQIVQLNYSLDALQQRYNKAKKDNHKSFRYSLRLRIAVVDGMHNMFYEYAHKKAEAVVELRQELFGEIVDVVSGETDVEMYE